MFYCFILLLFNVFWQIKYLNGRVTTIVSVTVVANVQDVPLWTILASHLSDVLLVLWFLGPDSDSVHNTTHLHILRSVIMVILSFILSSTLIVMNTLYHIPYVRMRCAITRV